MVLASESVASAEKVVTWGKQRKKIYRARRSEWDIICSIIDSINRKIDWKTGLLLSCNLDYSHLERLLVKMHRTGFIVIQEIQDDTTAKWKIAVTEKARTWRLMVKTVDELAPK